MKLFWRLYAFLFFAIAIRGILEILIRDSFLSVYYNTSIVFDNWFLLPYFFNILSVFINLIISVYIFGYAFDVPFLMRLAPWLFFFRLLCDALGHSYGFKVIQAGFHQGGLAGIDMTVVLLLPVFPSYVAQWFMTFQRAK